MSKSKKESGESAVNQKEGSSDVTFLHSSVSTSIVNGKKVTHEEFVIHGSKGLTFKYYHKDEKGIEKISGHQNADGTFSLTTVSGEKKDSKTVTKDELLKEIGKNKDLKFAVEYLKSQKGGKRSSRKGSKKGSIKSSKKSSKKGSRKGSMKW
jgi:hypothetical protein